MDLEYLQQNEWQRLFSESLLTNPWITVYESKREGADNITIFSGLVPVESIPKSLESESWDISIGQGTPGFVTYYDHGEERIEYQRNLNPHLIEPIVIFREFHGMKDDYLEIQEEFRSFHNLYADRKRNVLVKIQDDGSEDDAVEIESRKVRIKTKFLRQYIAAKQMGLAIYFDSFRYSKSEFSTDEYSKFSLQKHEKDISYFVHIGPLNSILGDENKSISRLLGKRIFFPPKIEKSGIWPFNEKKEKFEEFIIGTDEDGRLVYCTSNPDKLANYFGANPDAPHYLTPVFFKKEVLSKYYNNPEKFSVEDGYLRCGGLWGIRIDNDHPDLVMVFLGDLGRDLSHSEQLYWKSNNISPEGKMSATCFKRSFLAQPTNPDSEDLIFKYKFDDFSKNWIEKFEWPLFLPLAEKDSHLFTSLRIPVINDQSEFDSQILAIAKILIDSLNEKELGKANESGGKDLPGIAKFRQFLIENSMPNHDEYIDFLKDLYALRSSGVGHRKGKKFEKVAERFELQKKPLKEVFIGILKKAEGMLYNLEKHFFNH